MPDFFHLGPYAESDDYGNVPIYAVDPVVIDFLPLFDDIQSDE